MHLPGEQLSVTVHGQAQLTVGEGDHILGGFREICVEYYGDDWLQWGNDAIYFRIQADRMFTFWMPEQIN